MTDKACTQAGCPIEEMKKAGWREADMQIKEHGQGQVVTFYAGPGDGNGNEVVAFMRPKPKPSMDGGHITHSQIQILARQ